MVISNLPLFIFLFIWVLLSWKKFPGYYESLLQHCNKLFAQVFHLQICVLQILAPLHPSLAGRISKPLLSLLLE